MPNTKKRGDLSLSLGLGDLLFEGVRLLLEVRLGLLAGGQKVVQHLRQQAFPAHNLSTFKKKEKHLTIPRETPACKMRHVVLKDQCCGSGMFFPDPRSEFFHPGSRVK